MYATDVRRQTDVRETDVGQNHRLMPHLLGAGDNKRRSGVALAIRVTDNAAIPMGLWPLNGR